MTNEVNSDRNVVNDNAASRNNERKAKKEGMKKGVMTTAIISFLLLVIAGFIVNSMYKNEQKKHVAIVENQKHSFTQLVSSRDSVINEWMLTFDEIEKDLNTVKEKENIISTKSDDKEFTKDKKQQILKDIEYVNTLLDQNKKKIASLTAQLKNSGSTIKGLQVKVAELEATMKQRETEIADLKVTLTKKDFEIGQLNTRMTDQQVAIAQKDEKISNQTAQINKGFIAYGTYKTLKAKGIISKEGGFLGLGKKEALHRDFSDSLFTQVNISETKSIPVNSKDARLITDHPTNSYTMIRDKDNKIASIEIKDPDQFWKISKYAVVELK
jgi:septal ring factor EnvC (AmiA/AmiB activator)